MKKFLTIILCVAVSVSAFCACVPNESDLGISEQNTEVLSDSNISNSEHSTEISSNVVSENTDVNASENIGDRNYTIYYEVAAGASEKLLPEGSHELKRLESKFKFSFSNSYSELGKTLSEDQKKPITFLLNGKQVQITPTKAYSTPFANSKNEALKMENTYFEVDDKTATLMYTNEGRLVLYLNRDSPESTSAMTIEQLKTTATNVLEDLYGKDFVSKYVIANVATSEMLSGNRGSVRFVRQVHGYATEDYIQVAFDGFELLSIYALTSGYMDVVTDLTKEDIQAAENYLTQSMKLTLDHCEVTIDTDGELFLKARTEDAFYWISIE